jgi:sRNA-binding protein
LNKEGEEEKAIANDVQLDEVEYVSDQDDAANSPQKCEKNNEDSFCKMDHQSLKDAESYAMKWGSGKDDVVVWKILKDGESVSLHDNTFILPDTVEYNVDVTEEELKTLLIFSLSIFFRASLVS